MVEYEDMTPDERDRFIYLLLNEQALKAIVLIMKKRFGPDVSTDQIMRFAFKVARNRMTPAHLKKKPATAKKAKPARRTASQPAEGSAPATKRTVRKSTSKKNAAH